MNLTKKTPTSSFATECHMNPLVWTDRRLSVGEKHFLAADRNTKRVKLSLYYLDERFGYNGGKNKTQTADHA